MAIKCDKCLKLFSDVSNLRKHVKKFHPLEIESLGKYKHAEQDFTYTCQYCKKHFTYKHHFNFHLRSHEPDKPIEDNGSKKCSLCDYRSSLQKNLITHYEEKHAIKFIRTNMTFNTLDEFKEFLKKVEAETKSCFVKKMTTRHIIKLECNRSGEYLPKENRKRTEKTMITNKINAFCPASLTLRINKDGKFDCEFIENHIGHTNDVDYMSLSKEERKTIAAEIASETSFDDILDGVHKSNEEDPLDRIHLLKKRDLYNIKKSFNLNSTKNCNNTPSANNTVIDVNQEKKKIIQEFLEVTKSVKTEDQLRILRTTVETLNSNLEALERINRGDSIVPNETNAPHNNKNPTQKRLIIIKAKRKA